MTGPNDVTWSARDKLPPGLRLPRRTHPLRALSSRPHRTAPHRSRVARRRPPRVEELIVGVRQAALARPKMTSRPLWVEATALEFDDVAIVVAQTDGAE